MFRREIERKQASFLDQSRAVQSVPEDHPLMQMKRAVDWKAVETELARYYHPETGRPGLAPAVMVRMLVLEQYADLSDRDVHEQVGYNLLYRAFVGVGPDEVVPDDTTLVKFRARVGDEGMEKVFAELNRQWEAAGLIGSSRRVLDGVHFWAKVARRSWVELLRRGRALVLEALAVVDGARAEALRAEYVVAAAGPDVPKEEAWRREKQLTEKLLAAVADVQDERVRDRAEILRAMMVDEGARPVSFEDPDARWGHKAPDKPFCGYKSHESLDPDSRMITGVDVVAGNANEAVQTDGLLEKEPTPRDEGAAIIADGLYNNATTEQQVRDAGGRPCFAGLKAERLSDKFEYDALTDQIICPEGQRSIGKSRLGRGDLYYFSTTACAACPRRQDCLTRGEREGTAQPRRRIYLSDVRRQRRVEGTAGESWRKENLRVRGRIEAKFDEQMNRHGLRYARYWGLAKVTVQVLLNAITVNMKRAAKLLARALAPPGHRPVPAQTMEVAR